LQEILNAQDNEKIVGNKSNLSIIPNAPCFLTTSFSIELPIDVSAVSALEFVSLLALDLSLTLSFFIWSERLGSVRLIFSSNFPLPPPEVGPVELSLDEDADAIGGYSKNPKTLNVYDCFNANANLLFTNLRIFR
jgi:hypothetical protein